MKRIYTVIYNSDGDTHVSEHTEQEFKELLEQEYWGGEVVYELPKETDTNYWGDVIVALERLI